jgi:nucleoid DNA-binding protein
VFDELNVIIKKSLKSAGEFTMPGLMKVRVVKKPATKARLGKNPFTGEEITIKAKPARKAVKVSPLKGLKDMI